jgi:SAM-dependent methyltransferase
VTADPGPMYEALAARQWRRWLSRERERAGGADAFAGLEVRKRLSPPEPALRGERPADGQRGLDVWLRGSVATAAPTVLDLGCGFGASLLRWCHDDRDATGIGVTPSAFQVARANEVAAAHGLAPRCRFVQQSMSDPLPLREQADAVLAIEALGHEPDLAAALRHTLLALRPGGRLLWLEDLLTKDAPRDTDVQALARAWRSPPLRTVAVSHAALAAAGFQLVHDIDLTAQVAPAGSAALRRRAIGLALLRALPVPRLCAVVDAFAGGVHLERLYSRGLVGFRLAVAERPRV